jgi:F-type H+-transporting ATPase subunit b
MSNFFNPVSAVVFAAEEGGLLSLNWTVFVTVGVFLVVALTLNALVFKPVLQVLDERERRTSGSISDAQDLAKRYERRLEEYETALRQARLEAYQEMERQRATALQERTELIQRVKEEAGAELARAKRELADQVQASRATLVAEANQMAAAIAAAILGRTVGNS